MIRHVANEKQIYILGVFNKLWVKHAFPRFWEMAMVFPFAKPGKDSTVVSNYRFIALTSCLCKLMEKMVNVRYLERSKFCSPSQYGFHKMHSIDILIWLESFCEGFAAEHETLF